MDTRPPLQASASPAPAVHVVDDDEALRTGLDSLFRSIGYETHCFASTAEFMQSGRVANSGCLVLDVRLPGTNGLDFQQQLAAAGVTMPVILMTGHGDIPMSVRGMKAGAIDFLPKPFREQDMLDAVHAALERDRVTRVDRQKTEDLRARHEALTPRERQVMVRVAQGKLNKQIAFELNLSEITIKIHRGNAMRKMDARNLAEFVRMAEALELREEAV
jgi:FixJ family two-component response regulator